MPNKHGYTCNDIKGLREGLDMTQREFAEFTRLPIGTIASTERRGEKQLSAPMAQVYKILLKQCEEPLRLKQEARDLLAGNKLVADKSDEASQPTNPIVRKPVYKLFLDGTKIDTGRTVISR